MEPRHAKATASDDDESLSPNEKQAYKSIVGSLMYVTIGSRPGLAFAISVLSKHLSSPTYRHREMAKQCPLAHKCYRQQ
jgi:hypothetical protein